MQASLDQDHRHHTVCAYQPGQITVSVPFTNDETTTHATIVPLHHDRPASRRETLSRSLIILPGRLIRDWPPSSIGELTSDHFAALSEITLEVLLLGTGPKLSWPAPSLLAAITAQGMGVEVMDTGAACRTYNILVSDQRNVAAALIIGS